MHLSFEHCILSLDSPEIRLEDDIHRIEKEWDIEDRITHRENLTADRHRDKVTESDRCCRDDREVERIEVALPDRISMFQVVDEDCSYDPASEKDETDLDILAVVDMEHREWFLEL